MAQRHAPADDQEQRGGDADRRPRATAVTARLRGQRRARRARRSPAEQPGRREEELQGAHRRGELLAAAPLPARAQGAAGHRGQLQEQQPGLGAALARVLVEAVPDQATQCLGHPLDRDGGAQVAVAQLAEVLACAVRRPSAEALHEHRGGGIDVGGRGGRASLPDLGGEVGCRCHGGEAHLQQPDLAAAGEHHRLRPLIATGQAGVVGGGGGEQGVAEHHQRRLHRKQPGAVQQGAQRHRVDELADEHDALGGLDPVDDRGDGAMAQSTQLDEAAGERGVVGVGEEDHRHRRPPAWRPRHGHRTRRAVVEDSELRVPLRQQHGPNHR